MEEVTQDNSVRETRPANLSLIGRQLKARQEHQGGQARLPEHILFFLRGQHILALDASRIAEFARSGPAAVTLKGGFAKHLSLASSSQLRGTTHLAIFNVNDHLLLVTNRQKLITASAADLYLAAQADRAASPTCYHWKPASG